MYTLAISIHLVLEGIAGAIRQENEIKDIQIRKEDVKLSLMLYKENSKEYSNKTLELIHEFSEVA